MNEMIPNATTATYLRLCILLTYFLLALDTVELGKSILLPLKYSGFLLLLLSSVNLFFFFFWRSFLFLTHFPFSIIL